MAIYLLTQRITDAHGLRGNDNGALIVRAADEGQARQIASWTVSWQPHRWSQQFWDGAHADCERIDPDGPPEIIMEDHAGI
jgi:hypothetical protein